MDDINRTMLADHGVDIEYRKVGGSVFDTVRAYVGSSSRSRAAMTGQRLGGFGTGATARALTHPSHSMSGRSVYVLGSAVGADISVSSGVAVNPNGSTGVYRLMPGDTIKIAGRLVGQPAISVVTLTVGQDITFNGAAWEGTLS